MFLKSAQVYDLIYGFKDYKAETEMLRGIIAEYAPNAGRTLLDVACGTGIHAKLLGEYFSVTGLDLDKGLLEVARERAPHIPFHQGDMRNFDLGTQFDVVTCLFSAVGYVGTVDALNATIATFARHTRVGGLVLVEPWFYPGQLTDKYVGVRTVDESTQLKVVRMSTTTIENNVSTLHFHYMVGTLDGIQYFTEEHHITMFTREEYVAAFEAAGLRVTLDTPGLEGRGLYIGVKA